MDPTNNKGEVLINYTVYRGKQGRHMLTHAMVIGGKTQPTS